MARTPSPRSSTPATFKEVKRLTIGQGGANIGFSRDGRTAFIAVRGANDVAVIDMAKLALAGRIRAREGSLRG